MALSAESSGSATILLWNPPTLILAFSLTLHSTPGPGDGFLKGPFQLAVLGNSGWKQHVLASAIFWPSARLLSASYYDQGNPSSVWSWTSAGLQDGIKGDSHRPGEHSFEIRSLTLILRLLGRLALSILFLSSLEALPVCPSLFHLSRLRSPFRPFSCYKGQSSCPCSKHPTVRNLLQPP
jgi:hypothetical protein